MKLPNQFHEIQQAFENDGHTLLFLPLYSPFFNVAEWVLGHIKSYVQQMVSKIIKHH